MAEAPRQAKIGTWRGVSLEIVAWDGAMAAVDLSVACMFEREAAGDGPAGGLRHLDDALGGALTGLRRSGTFRASLLETLLIGQPPATVAARAVLLVGLGDPAAWNAGLSGRAAATAVRSAAQMHAVSAAFAPSVLDAGLAPRAGEDLSAAMLDAVLDAIDAQERIAGTGLALPLALRRWTFDVGPSHFDASAERFLAAFERRRSAA